MDLLAFTAPSAVHVSTDAAIIATVALMIVYGLVAGQLMLARFAASVYVGLVLATYATEPVLKAIGSGSLGGVGATQTTIQLVLLILPIVLLQFGHHKVHGRHKPEVVQALLMAVLTAFLVIAAVFMQLDDLARSRLLDESFVASQLYAFKLVWIASVPVAIVVFHFLHGKAELPRKR